MMDLLKSKIVTGFLIFGAFFALLLSVISGASFFAIIIRILVGTFLMGAIGIGLDYFLRQSLSSEEYSKLFQKNSGVSADNTGKSSKRIDILDQSENDQSSGYENFYKEEIMPKNEDINSIDNLSPSEALKNNAVHIEDSFPDEMPSVPPSSASKEFKEETFEDAPRAIPVDYEENLIKEDVNAPIKQEISRLGEVKKEEEQLKKTRSTDGSVQFKAGNKNVSVDPKIIAKAIQTVLNRDS